MPIVSDESGFAGSIARLASQDGPTGRRPRLRMPAVTTFVLLLLSALAAGAPAALAASGARPASKGAGAHSAALSASPDVGRARYVRPEQVCPPPQPGYRQCYAVRLEPVSSSATNAVGAVTSIHEGPGSGGLTPEGFAEAYDLHPTVGGSGQTIGIVDANDDPKIESDLKHYDEHYGLAECTTANGCFRKVGQTGSSSELPAPPKNLGELAETSLDVESARAVCQNCKILLVEADSLNNANLSAAADEAAALGATEISNSYGSSEPYEPEAYNHPGVVVVAASGDEGYNGWAAYNVGNSLAEGPEYPAGFPTVVAAGGTSLEINSEGKVTGASVWNQNGPDDEPGFKDEKKHDVTGTGCSASFSAPLWQLNVPNYSATGCGSERLSTDISAESPPGASVYDSNTGGEWYDFDGTSLSSPLIAAMFALAGGSGGVEYPASTLYAHFGQSALLADVTKGGNSYCDATSCTPPKSNMDCKGTTVCNAAAGYDGPSGVGTPIGLGAFIPLSVAIRPPGVVTQTSATLKGIVDPHYETVNECGFEYKQSGKSHVVACKLGPGSGDSPVEVSAKITGLTPNTAASYRVLAGFYGLLASTEVGFTTAKVAAPAVETKGSGSVGASSATVYASVNPRGASVSTCKFEYGTTTSYGSSVSCASLPGAGSSPVVVDASIGSGLAADTTYHYRISATNSSGTSKGGDATFKTS